jgi:hypothetical protein
MAMTYNGISHPVPPGNMVLKETDIALEAIVMECA